MMLFRPLIIALTVFCIGLGPLLPDMPNISAVWEHYQHHRTEHGENTLTFVEFLVDHFAGANAHEEEHGALPLHSVVPSVPSFVKVAVATDVQPYFAELGRKTITTSSTQPSSKTLSKIWTPPRS